MNDVALAQTALNAAPLLTATDLILYTISLKSLFEHSRQFYTFSNRGCKARNLVFQCDSFNYLTPAQHGWPCPIAIVGDGGWPILTARMDGAPVVAGIELAQEKARQRQSSGALNRPGFPRHSPSSGNSVSHTLLEQHLSSARSLRSSVC